MDSGRCREPEASVSRGLATVEVAEGWADSLQAVLLAWEELWLILLCRVARRIKLPHTPHPLRLPKLSKIHHQTNQKYRNQGEKDTGGTRTVVTCNVNHTRGCGWEFSNCTVTKLRICYSI